MFNLTPREKRVARSLCTDHSIAEIAAELNLKTGTVKNLAHRVYKILGVRDRQHLVATLLLPLDSPLREDIA